VWFTTRSPWPVKSRLAELRKGPGRPQRKLRRRRLLRGVRGSTDQAIVLALRFDCRSWQAARGLGDHGRRTRHHRLDLALPCESSERSERAPEAGPRRQSFGHGGGLPPRKRQGSTCRWKAPRIGEAALVDARGVDAVLALRGRSAVGFCGARQGASEAGSPALDAADNAATGRLCLRAEPFSSFD
jgi:hypothetical protein